MRRGMPSERSRPGSDSRVAPRCPPPPPRRPPAPRCRHGPDGRWRGRRPRAGAAAPGLPARGLPAADAPEARVPRTPLRRRRLLARRPRREGAAAQAERRPRLPGRLVWEPPGAQVLGDGRLAAAPAAADPPGAVGSGRRGRRSPEAPERARARARASNNCEAAGRGSARGEREMVGEGARSGSGSQGLRGTSRPTSAG